MSGSVFLQMVNLLLSKGADASAKDKKERQAIHWAAHLGKRDTHTYGDKESPAKQKLVIKHTSST